MCLVVLIFLLFLLNLLENKISSNSEKICVVFLFKSYFFWFEGLFHYIYSLKNEPPPDKTNKMSVPPDADAQADLSLRWAHTNCVGFVMSRLKCYIAAHLRL